MVTSDNWNIHVKDRTRFMIDRTDLIDEEIRLLERADGAFPDIVHSVFDEVKRGLGLDYFGMDFGIDGQGDVVLFEANATMSSFPLEPHPRFAYLSKLREPAQQAFSRMLFHDGEGRVIDSQRAP